LIVGPVFGTGKGFVDRPLHRGPKLKPATRAPR
jgi:hypothetical protein